MGKGKDGIYVQAAIDRKHEQEAIRISSIKKFRDELSRLSASQEGNLVIMRGNKL